MAYAEATSDESVDHRLARLNKLLREAPAQSIIHAAQEEFGDRVCYVSSFGAESAVMLSLIADVNPDFPVLFIDTGMHFFQTLQYRDELIEKLGLTNVRTIDPIEEDRLATDPNNDLWKTDTDACCALRKVRSLEPALEGFDAWITGRKRFQGSTRMRLPVFEYADGRFKVNPLASWTPEDVNLFFKTRNLPQHPLVEQGYPSIGCWPCTSPVKEGEDARAGRWAGQDKTECGIHVEKAQPRRPQAF
ncbi:MAG: phosphoadenylyl-sulfate reductase [Hirschia sp.]|nr:phosphoadenylyl-sulfate reductase [Hirschia sp.]MBF18602.1 phosphoadenylyl-sulfate reductase [Hirschia sp.]|tara:strand:+ start:87 stop:827 length:741 start_codon:yes stop_codon:yes gene_type:complete